MISKFWFGFNLSITNEQIHLKWRFIEIEYKTECLQYTLPQLNTMFLSESSMLLNFSPKDILC